MKKTKILSLILSAVFVFAVIPVTANTEDVIIKVLVEPLLDFDYVRDFSNGMAMVIKDDKYGYIDKTGKIIIPLIYEYAYDFKYGVAIVRTREKIKDNDIYYYGLIDKTGKYILPLEYEYILDFYDGLAEVRKNGKRGVVDNNGKIVIPIEYDEIRPYRYMGHYDKPLIFSDGLAAVSKDDKWGYIDKTNKTVIPFRYDDAHAFGEGLAAVSLNGKYRYIDKNGKTVINCDGYTPVEPFSDGLSVVIGERNPMGEGGDFGYIDKTGKFVIPLERYEYAMSFYDGYARVIYYSKANNGHYIDKKGKRAEEPVYYSADDLAIVSEGWVSGSIGEGVTFGVVDKTGKQIIPMEYNNINDFYYGVTVARKDGENYMIDKTGKIIKTFDFDYVSGFNDEGLAIVANGEFSLYGFKKDKTSAKWGIIQIVKVGYPIGNVLYSDITAYINGNVIPTSVIDGKTLVVVEDLARYGFDVKWNGADRSLKVELNKNKKITPLTVEKDTKHKSGTFKCNYLYTDIKTYLSGEEVESYAIDGVTLADFELLAKYGKLTWDSKTREIWLTIR